MKLAQRYEKLKRDYEILKIENDKLREKNQNLKQGNTGYNRLLIVKTLMQKTSCGLTRAKEALDKFNWNEKMALHYLYIKGDCVARKRKDGKPWTDQDYINYVIEEYKKENK